jgi:hypothetical protein
VRNEVGTVARASTIGQAVISPPAPRPPVLRLLPRRVGEFSGRPQEVAAPAIRLPEFGNDTGSATIATAPLGKLVEAR